MSVPRFYCRDIYGVVHAISNDPYTDDLKVECGRKFVWAFRSKYEWDFDKDDTVGEAKGPATCLMCIAEMES